MSMMKNKIDFALLVSVKMANPNGDPLNGNRPRIDYNGFGEISDVCIKRKIRNRMQDFGHKIFVQSDDRKDDDCTSLSKRAEVLKDKKDDNEYAKEACEKWLDVRSFGQVFAFESEGGKKNKKAKKDDNEKGRSVGVRGPISIHQAVSVDPIETHSLQITKSVNGKEDDKKGSDTMGMKHMVRFGLYVIKGSINVQLAEKTGFSQEDAEVIKQCLLTLFENDASSARPDGSMEVCKLYWWKHNCRNGQYPSAKVHRLLQVKLKDGVESPNSFEDYEVKLNKLEGLDCEVSDGK